MSKISGVLGDRLIKGFAFEHGNISRPMRVLSFTEWLTIII